MAATIRSFTPYLVGLALLGVAVAGLLPGALDAACGIAGIVVMAAYGVQRARSGELGYRRGPGPGYFDDGTLPPADGGHHHHGGHGGHGGDGGWFGGGHAGGHGGHGG